MPLFPRPEKDTEYRASDPFVRLWVTNLDIDNDGIPESVFKYRSWSCRNKWDERRSHFAALYVFDSKGELDREKTWHLMQNPEKKYATNSSEALDGKDVDLKYEYSKYAPGFMRLVTYDVFLFQGKTYFDRWHDADFNPALELELSPLHQSLQVFLTENDATREICRFKYLS